jgi:hypothetical protein
VIFGGRKGLIYVEGYFPGRSDGGVSVRAGGSLSLAPPPARRQPMDDHVALRSGGKVAPLRPKTIDDGEIRVGPVRVEPLTAAQESEAVELLTALFAAALQRQRSSSSLRRAA